MRWLVAGLLISLSAGCNEESSMGGGAVVGSAGGGSAAAKPAGGGGGFSADLAKEFANATGGKAGSAEMKAGSGDAKAGSASSVAVAGDAKAGSAEMKAGSAEPAAAGSADAKVAGDAKAGSAEMKAGSAEPVAKAGSGDAKAAGDAKAGSADAAPKAGAAETPRVGTGPGPVIQPSGAPPKKVVVPAELAAFKFGMLPNWERDVQDAGTISLAVKIPGRSDSAVFVFRYGYEDAGAPADREAYKKWLADKKLLTVRQDRQAGAAWFLEGADGSGNPAFRVVVNWGGRKLVCYGSLYRDAESNRLGDLRDQTIIQAKQICETIAL